MTYSFAHERSPANTASRENDEQPERVSADDAGDSGGKTLDEYQKLQAQQRSSKLGEKQPREVQEDFGGAREVHASDSSLLQRSRAH